MENFTFYSPTEFVFGKGTQNRVGELIKKHGGNKVLVHYGKGSVVRSGLLNEVLAALDESSISYVTLGGVNPNPTDDLVYEGICLCRKEDVDFILAVGGGSVIDSSKAIAAGTYYDGDFWDFFEGKKSIDKALKVATVLTIPAAGSEGSGNSVITKLDGKFKRGVGSPLLRPVFSILNPETCFSLSNYQTACGIADMIAHVMERYFTNTKNVDITDRVSEGVLKTIINKGLEVINSENDYDSWANLMWSGTLAHNGICGVGRVEDWSSHALEHELSALYDVPHGAGLAVIIPSWMRYVVDENIDRFVMFATNVWGIYDVGNRRDIALKGIDKLEEYFIKIGLPVTFNELGARSEDIDYLVKQLDINQEGKIGNFKELNMSDAKKIYSMCCK